MIVPASTVQRIANPNMGRGYFAVQSMDTVLANIVYILPYEAEAEVFLNNGFALGGYGVFEIQNCLTNVSKSAWYAYTTVATGINLRVVDL